MMTAQRKTRYFLILLLLAAFAINYLFYIVHTINTQNSVSWDEIYLKKLSQV